MTNDYDYDYEELRTSREALVAERERYAALKVEADKFRTPIDAPADDAARGAVFRKRRLASLSPIFGSCFGGCLLVGFQKIPDHRLVAKPPATSTLRPHGLAGLGLLPDELMSGNVSGETGCSVAKCTGITVLYL